MLKSNNPLEYLWRIIIALIVSSVLGIGYILTGSLSVLLKILITCVILIVISVITTGAVLWTKGSEMNTKFKAIISKSTEIILLILMILGTLLVFGSMIYMIVAMYLE